MFCTGLSLYIDFHLSTFYYFCFGAVTSHYLRGKYETSAKKTQIGLLFVVIAHDGLGGGGGGEEVGVAMHAPTFYEFILLGKII